MDSFPRYLNYKNIYLEDAKSIVRYSFIVQNSVTHLDLSTCEYTSYQKQIRKSLNCLESRVSKSYIQTEEDCRKFFNQERALLYSLNLDLSKDLEPRMGQFYWYAFHKTARSSRTSYLGLIETSYLWYRNNLREYLIQFLRQTDRKLDSLRKFMDSRIDIGVFKFLRFGTNFFGCMDSNILCCEIEESGNLRGVLIAVNKKEQFTVTNEVDVVLYQNYSKENGLQKNMFSDMNIVINFLFYNRLYQFLPTALIYGHAPRFLQKDLDYMQNAIREYRNISEEQLLKGVREGVFSVNRNGLLMLNLLALLESERMEAKRETTRYVLSIMWRAIPDPFLSRKEVEYAYKNAMEEDLFNLFNNFYEEIVGEYPRYPTPRSLKHYSRMVIRTLLRDSGFLPGGINHLDISLKLQSYLKLRI